MSVFTDAIETARDRYMEMLLAAVSDSTEAFPYWYGVGLFPYWVTMPTSLQDMGGPRNAHVYEINGISRLVLSHAAEIMEEPEGDVNLQVKSWIYLAEAVDYFRKNKTMNPEGMDPIKFISSRGMTFFSAEPPDLDAIRVPVQTTLYALDFTFMIPLEIGVDE